MSKVRVASFSVSLDGFGAGPDQDLQNPMGVGGMVLHAWAFPTRTFKKMQGGEGGSTGVDETFAARGFENVGAWILGRNMFGPVRGPGLNGDWRGWGWGCGGRSTRRTGGMCALAEERRRCGNIYGRG